MQWILALGLLGCKGECQPDSRMDGGYAVWSYVTAATEDIGGDNIADYPWPAMFFNGWSEWTLQYIPAQSNVQIELDGQPFTATFYRAPDTCEDFTMSFSGTWLSDWGTRHSFQWDGDLSYQGPQIGGTFTYSDTWSDPEAGTTGSIDIPLGEISMNAGAEIGDTGG